MEKEMPLVSIVVPVYNVGKYLRQCLDSIMNQTFCYFEAICVNDGATDESRTILQEYAELDKRIKIIDQDNKGLSEARNTGIRASCGKYLYFVDSDDYIDHKALELLVAKMENLSLDMVLCNVAAFADDSKNQRQAEGMNQSYFVRRINEKDVQSGLTVFTEMCGRGEWIATVFASMIRRSFVSDHNLFFIPGIYHEDEPWTFKALVNAERVSGTNERLYYYRIRSGSISNTNVSFSHVYGCYIGLKDIQNTIKNIWAELDDHVRKVLISHTGRLQRGLIARYRECPPEEKEKRELLSVAERLDFEMLAVIPSEQMDEIDVRISVSYRIGRFLTWIPRKIKNCLRS